MRSRQITYLMLAGLLGSSSAGCGADTTATFDLGHKTQAADMTETQAELITNGEADVNKRGCPMCHQSTSAADGVLSGGNAPVPGTMIIAPNLTPDPDTGLSYWTDAQIIRAMRENFDIEGRALCWVMPHWQIGDREAIEIVAYLRSLKPVMRDIPIGVCPPLTLGGSDGGSRP